MGLCEVDSGIFFIIKKIFLRESKEDNAFSNERKISYCTIY